MQASEGAVTLDDGVKAHTSAAGLNVDLHEVVMLQGLFEPSLQCRGSEPKRWLGLP